MAKYRFLVASFALAAVLLVAACGSATAINISDHATTETRGVTPCKVWFSVEINDTAKSDRFDIAFIQLGENDKELTNLAYHFDPNANQKNYDPDHATHGQEISDSLTVPNKGFVRVRIVVTNTATHDVVSDSTADTRCPEDVR